MACFSLIGLLFIPPADPLAPQISTTDIASRAPRYFNPTLGSVHQIKVPGVGWTLTTYKRMVANLDDPSADPAPGDTYFCPKVGGYWVWSVLRGTDGPDLGVLKIHANGFHFHLAVWAPKRLVQA